MKVEYPLVAKVTVTQTNASQFIEQILPVPGKNPLEDSVDIKAYGYHTGPPSGLQVSVHFTVPQVCTLNVPVGKKLKITIELA